jgi:ketosteroid isomerase-like protein
VVARPAGACLVELVTNTLRRILLAASIALTTGATAADAQSAALRRAVDELLEVDREHANRAQRANVVDALAGMFADDVVMSAVGTFHAGREAALTQLRSVPENLTGRLEWSPVRGGVSGDGQHGFTYGFMTLVRADSSRVALKYLAYWVRKPDGWKVAVYRRVLRPAGEVSKAMREPSLPERTVEATRDAMTIARHARELGNAERDFSTLAGKIGLGPAFTQNAAPDAMNMGGPQSADFLFGPEAIGAGVGEGQSGPSTLTWGPDTVLVASSGDLGVTIGHILPKPEPGGQQRRIPFFTVWKKVGGVWRFVAE